MTLRATIISSIEESKKKTKKEVDYSVGMRKKKCGLCRYFIPEQRGSDDGECRKVKGRINAEMWCKLFEHK